MKKLMNYNGKNKTVLSAFIQSTRDVNRCYLWITRFHRCAQINQNFFREIIQYSNPAVLTELYLHTTCINKNLFLFSVIIYKHMACDTFLHVPRFLSELVNKFMGKRTTRHIPWKEVSHFTILLFTQLWAK